MHEAIQAMGFYPTVRIVKSRRTAHADGVSFCLDQVIGLGAFLELERMVPDDASGHEVQAQLAALVESLGVDVERSDETYDGPVRACAGRKLGHWV